MCPFLGAALNKHVNTPGVDNGIVASVVGLWRTLQIVILRVMPVWHHRPTVVLFSCFAFADLANERKLRELLPYVKIAVERVPGVYG